jgi:dTDP-4-amino-4,6-dideoxygalactose transaminase
LKQKVRVEDVGAGDRVARRLQRRGYRVGNFNWQALLGGAADAEFPVASQAANLWLDVPVHQNLSAEAIDEIAQALVRA